MRSSPSGLSFCNDYVYVDELSVSGVLAITRTTLGTSLADGGSVLSCSWPLPPCEMSSAVTVATIAADLADADVQAGFAASATPLYGQTIADAGIYTIARADGRAIDVGWGCNTGTGGTCQDIPPGVQRLVTDALSDPTCHALSL